jgi:hypothetical protein
VLAATGSTTAIKNWWRRFTQFYLGILDSVLAAYGSFFDVAEAFFGKMRFLFIA